MIGKQDSDTRCMKVMILMNMSKATKERKKRNKTGREDNRGQVKQ